MTRDISTEEDQSDAGERRARGEFVRGVSGFRHSIGDPDFPPEPGRYHLFVALNCPWCHRVTLARTVRGLCDGITMDVASPRAFSSPPTRRCGPKNAAPRNLALTRSSTGWGRISTG